MPMRSSALVLSVVGAVLLSLGNPAHSDDAASTFFNGKDTAGWEGLPGFWSVKDGAIVGTAPADLKFNTFLCSKQKYKDFELKFRVRLKDGKGNSGVQIRSKVRDNPKDKAN